MDDHVQVGKKSRHYFLKICIYINIFYISTFKKERKKGNEGQWPYSFSIWAEAWSPSGSSFPRFCIIFLYFIVRTDFSPISSFSFLLGSDSWRPKQRLCKRERERETLLYLLRSRRSTQEKNRWQFDQRRARRGRERKPSCVHTFLYECESAASSCFFLFLFKMQAVFFLLLYFITPTVDLTPLCTRKVGPRTQQYSRYISLNGQRWAETGDARCSSSKFVTIDDCGDKSNSLKGNKIHPRILTDNSELLPL